MLSLFKMSCYVCKTCFENKSGEEIIKQQSIINIVKNKCIFCNKKQSFHSRLSKNMSKIYKKCKRGISNIGVVIGTLIIGSVICVICVVAIIIDILFEPLRVISNKSRDQQIYYVRVVYNFIVYDTFL
jgi:protein-arginine kinase activator protein McsA